jgi:hypothetical protein
VRRRLDRDGHRSSLPPRCPALPWEDNGNWYVANVNHSTGGVNFARADLNGDPYSDTFIADSYIHEALHFLNPSWTETEVISATTSCLALVDIQ